MAGYSDAALDRAYDDNEDFMAENTQHLKLLRECRPMVEHCKKQSEHSLFGEGCPSPSFKFSELSELLARIDAALNPAEPGKE